MEAAEVGEACEEEEHWRDVRLRELEPDAVG